MISFSSFFQAADVGWNTEQHNVDSERRKCVYLNERVLKKWFDYARPKAKKILIGGHSHWFMELGCKFGSDRTCSPFCKEKLNNGEAVKFELVCGHRCGIRNCVKYSSAKDDVVPSSSGSAAALATANTFQATSPQLQQIT